MTISLLCKDLDFELPHHINIENIKSNILQEVSEEEKRLSKVIEKKAEQTKQAELERLRSKKVNYETYFNILPNYSADIIPEEQKRSYEGKNVKKEFTLEEFSKDYSKKFMFDNDLLEEAYLYCNYYFN
jgi:hypothetical protein